MFIWDVNSSARTKRRGREMAACSEVSGKPCMKAKIIVCKKSMLKLDKGKFEHAQDVDTSFSLVSAVDCPATLRLASPILGVPSPRIEQKYPS